MLTAKELFTEKDYEVLSYPQRAHILKIERAKEESGLRGNACCDFIFSMIDNSLYASMSYKQLGQYAAKLYESYTMGANHVKRRMERSLARV